MSTIIIFIAILAVLVYPMSLAILLWPAGVALKWRNLALVFLRVFLAFKLKTKMEICLGQQGVNTGRQRLRHGLFFKLATPRRICKNKRRGWHKQRPGQFFVQAHLAPGVGYSRRGVYECGFGRGFAFYGLHGGPAANDR